MRCGRAGNTSVRYEVGIFRNDEDEASAEGYLVHVYVDRATQKTPTPLPDTLRAALQRITLNPSLFQGTSNVRCTAQAPCHSG